MGPTPHQPQPEGPSASHLPLALPTSHIPEWSCSLTLPFQTLKTGMHFLPQWLLQEAQSLSQDALSRGDCQPGTVLMAGILDSDGGRALHPLGLLLGPEGFGIKEKPTEIKSKGPEQKWGESQEPNDLS